MGEVDFLGVEDRSESRRIKLRRMVEGTGADSELNREVGSGGGFLGRGVLTFSEIFPAVGAHFRPPVPGRSIREPLSHSARRLFLGRLDTDECG
ncbi:MAG: hypothetical protein QXG08_03570 [Candidatus Methanomethyliaceae archaeon]